LLGSSTFSSNNAIVPWMFGTIDSPVQGATISGVIPIFGWILARQPNSVAPGSVRVFVDGYPVGFAIYGGTRADIASLFPGFNDANRAGFHFLLDTRKLKNGVHSIFVQAIGGAQTNVGGRYVIVDNH
jgi:hypothetical protein